MAIFIAACASIWAARAEVFNRVEPQNSTALSVRALNGNDQDQANLLNSKSVFDWTDAGFASLTLLAAGCCFGSYLRRATRPEGK